MSPQFQDYFDHFAGAGTTGNDGRRNKVIGDGPRKDLRRQSSELCELRWRDGVPVEEPLPGDAPQQRKQNVPEARRLYPIAEGAEKWDGASGKAKAAVLPTAARSTASTEEAAEKMWKMWREGEGSSSWHRQGSRCDSVRRTEDSFVSGPAPRGRGRREKKYSTEQGSESYTGSDEEYDGSSQSSTVRRSKEHADQSSIWDRTIEYMKSLQQQIPVLSTPYGASPAVFQGGVQPYLEAVDVDVGTGANGSGLGPAGLPVGHPLLQFSTLYPCALFPSPPLFPPPVAPDLNLLRRRPRSHHGSTRSARMG